MLSEGDRVPDATVWAGPREPVRVAELAPGEPFLLFFYVFDWSST